MLTSTRLRGLALIGEALLIIVPLIVLGAAIDWPASLDDPAEIALPRLVANEASVRFGYLVYLGYSVLFLPAAVVATEWLGTRSAKTTAIRIAIGMAVVSTAMRAIGIVRWLSTMFPLAEQWQEATSATAREALAIQFQAINDFGGAIGETLGVSLFAALWLAFTAAAVWNDGPRWLAVVSGVAAGLAALPLIELAGIDSGPLVSVSSGAFTIWLLVIGTSMMRTNAARPRRAADQATTTPRPQQPSPSGR